MQTRLPLAPFQLPGTSRLLASRKVGTALVITLTLVAAPLAAQDPYDRDPRLVIREQVRDVIRGSVTVRDGARAYQGRDRGPEQTDRFSRKVRIGRDGRFTIENIAGDITLTAGTGDDVSIEAVKRTRGPRSQLDTVHILVDERPGRVEVKTDHTARTERVAVDYTVTVPASTGVDAKSVSGSLKITGVQGVVRAETISGGITTASTPKLEVAKSVSGDVDLTDATADADLNATTVSGVIRARGLKARTLDLGTVSGDVMLSNIACMRLGVRSVSGSVEYSGTLAKSGRYDINSHSGTVRLSIGTDVGFELSANSFSGSIRSELPMTLGPTSARNDRRRPGPGHSTHAVFGDGSAALVIRTFSGDIVITKR
jgi:DUF4097 and DUF4098 domain-containing protein YvlB